MSAYPIFALYFFRGIALCIILALVRLAGSRVPWYVILAPLGVGWICATWPWVLGFFYLLRVPPAGWEDLSLLLFLLTLIAVLIRIHRTDRRKAPGRVTA